MTKLDHVSKNNKKTNKDKLNDVIYNELTFDTSRFNSSRVTREPLPLVTVTLRGGRKHRATIVAGITFLWDNGSTNSMIKIKHNKHYEHKIRYNKVEYITVAGIHCTTHDAKVPFVFRSFLSAR